MSSKVDNNILNILNIVKTIMPQNWSFKIFLQPTPSESTPPKHHQSAFRFQLLTTITMTLYQLSHPYLSYILNTVIYHTTKIQNNINMLKPTCTSTSRTTPISSQHTKPSGIHHYSYKAQYMELQKSHTYQKGAKNFTKA